MKLATYLLTGLLLWVSACGAAADIKVELKPLQEFHQLGQSVPAELTLTNTGQNPVEIPQYLVPFYDFDLSIKNSSGEGLNRRYSIFDLSYLKPVGRQPLAAGGTYTQRINALQELYNIQQVGSYQVQAYYYPERDRAAGIGSEPVQFDIGNVAGDQAFLIFSDTAYIKKGFNFTTIFPNGNYYLREFSNNYYILGMRSSWFQLGLGYSDGLYSGAKWQLLAEQGLWPALSVQFAHWKASREVMSREKEIFGYWSEDKSTVYTLSKRLPARSHIHFGLKRYEVYTKLEGLVPVNNLYLLQMLALDQSYDFGMIMYELDHDALNNFRSEALAYRGFPSWEPQVDIGLVRYRHDSGRENNMLFISLTFYIDNFLLGYNF